MSLGQTMVALWLFERALDIASWLLGFDWYGWGDAVHLAWNDATAYAGLWVVIRLQRGGAPQ